MYRVLKELVVPSGDNYDVGMTIMFTDDHTKRYIDWLLSNGFIGKIKDEPWKPNYNDGYWGMDDEGEIFFEGRFSDNSVQDCNRFELGNCFQTGEQAVKAREWLKAFKVLRDDMKGHKPHFCEEQLFTVFYDHDNDELKADPACREQYGLIYFFSDDDAEGSIKKHQKEWLTFFGIEETVKEKDVRKTVYHNVDVTCNEADKTLTITEDTLTGDETLAEYKWVEEK